MSLELIKSPIYPYPAVSPAPITVNAVALLSQVYFNVQRDDMNGAGYTTFDSGGFLGISQGVILGAPQVGQRIFIEQDQLIPGQPIPTYRGYHLITEVLVVGSYKTDTVFVDTNNDGFATFQDFDVTTVEADIEIPSISDSFTQSYKIPYNKPVFGFDIGPAMRFVFDLESVDYYESKVVLTAENPLGVMTGTAIQSYDLQLYQAQMVKGREYGANLAGFVLRSALLGQVLTFFNQPKVYWGLEQSLSLYVDEVYATRTAVRQFYDINMQPLAVPLNTGITYDGLGIQDFIFTLVKGASPANSVFVGIQVTEIDTTPLTEEKIYKLEDFCQGRVMMAWANRMGGIDYYAFNIWNDSNIEMVQGLKYEQGGVYDDADNVNNLKTEQGHAQQYYTLTADGIRRDDLGGISGILASPQVEILTYDVLNASYTKLEVEVVDGFNVTFNAGQKTQHDFTCRISLPLDSASLFKLVSYPL